MECPVPPQFQLNTVMGTSNEDLVNDPPRYLDVAQYECPEGHVFEVYDEIPDENGTYNFIEDVQVVNLTCADYADWLPMLVPECIRMFFKR